MELLNFTLKFNRLCNYLVLIYTHSYFERVPSSLMKHVKIDKCLIDYHKVIVFNELRFQIVFCPHENKKHKLFAGTGAYLVNFSILSIFPCVGNSFPFKLYILILKSGKLIQQFGEQKASTIQIQRLLI